MDKIYTLILNKISEILGKKSIGIDISDNSIEVVELKKEKGKIDIKNFGRTELPKGVVNRGDIKDVEILEKALKEVLSSSKPNSIVGKSIVFGLPDNRVYTHIFSFKDSDLVDKNIEEKVSEEVTANIPIEADDVLFSYKVHDYNKGEKEIVVVAASKKFVLQWDAFFKKLGFKVDSFDVEPFAIYRELFSKLINDPVCVVDMGSSVTNVYLFGKKIYVILIRLI